MHVIIRMGGGSLVLDQVDQFPQLEIGGGVITRPVITQGILPPILRMGSSRVIPNRLQPIIAVIGIGAYLTVGILVDRTCQHVIMVGGFICHISRR